MMNPVHTVVDTIAAAPAAVAAITMPVNRDVIAGTALPVGRVNCKQCSTGKYSTNRGVACVIRLLLIATILTLTQSQVETKKEAKAQVQEEEVEEAPAKKAQEEEVEEAPAKKAQPVLDAIMSPCKAGTYLPVGSVNCEQCPYGKYSLDGAVECDVCPAGKYNDVEASPVCTDCPEGKSNFYDGSTKCYVSCGFAGTYIPVPLQLEYEGKDSSCASSYASRIWTLKTKRNEMFTNAGNPNPKLEVKVKEVSGEELQSHGNFPPWRDVESIKCCLCSPGQYSVIPGLPECRLCPMGKYNSEYGASVCAESCSPGKYSREVGAAASEDVCITCPAGTYSALPGSIDCTLCPSGASSNAGASMCAFAGINTAAGEQTTNGNMHLWLQYISITIVVLCLLYYCCIRKWRNEQGRNVEYEEVQLAPTQNEPSDNPLIHRTRAPKQ